MKKLRFDNTYKSGHVTYFIFPENKKFTAVCLEFDLIASGKTPEEAKEKIEDYSKGWLDNVIDNKLSEELLNKPVATF